MKNKETEVAAPTADASPSESFQFTENKSTAEVEQSQDEMRHEKARFLELRNGMAGWQWGLFHAIIFFGAAISGFDVSNVATVQVSIYHTFSHINLLPWLVTSFALGNAATSPTLDHIMKLVDLKWFTLGSWALTLVASAITGASPTIEGVIVGRTLQGVAGGGCYLALVTYNTVLARPTEHARLNGLLGMSYAIGLILGPVIGGAFAENEHATWRWAFYICVPYTAILMIAIFLALPHVRLRPRVDIGEGLRSIDWVGAFLHAAMFVIFDAACIFSGSTLAWKSGVIALWVLFPVVLILYAIQQSFSLFTVPAKRILPISVLSTRTGFLVMLSTFLACGGYSVALAYLPLYYAFTRGDDSLQVAVHILPYICVYVAAAIGSGIFLPIVRRYAAFYLLGGILIASGAGSMMSVNADSSLSRTMGIGAILGFGVGLTVQLGASVLALALPANIRMDSSIAMTLSLYSGTTVFLSVAGCIFQNIGFEYLSDVLTASDFSPEEIREALAGVKSPIWAKFNSETLKAAIGAVTTATIRIFYITTAAGALMAICALVMKWEALNFKPTQKKEVEEGSDGPEGVQQAV